MAIEGVAVEGMVVVAVEGMELCPPARAQAATHAPSTKPISGESNIVEMLLQFPALLQHATATGAGRNTAM